MIIRPATPTDAPQMTVLLNDIIAIGGSTAYQTPFDETRMVNHCIRRAELLSCSVAELDGVIQGFQWISWATEDDALPAGWTVIASFVASAAAGKGIGQHLFAATKKAAMDAGAAVIDATIRADNVAGLRYYSGLGFVDYDLLKDVPLQDGTRVDRVRKRFDLG